MAGAAAARRPCGLRQGHVRFGMRACLLLASVQSCGSSAMNLHSRCTLMRWCTSMLCHDSYCARELPSMSLCAHVAGIKADLHVLRHCLLAYRIAASTQNRAGARR